MLETDLFLLFKILSSPVFPILVNDSSTGFPFSRNGKVDVSSTSPLYVLIYSEDTAGTKTGRTCILTGMNNSKDINVYYNLS